MSDAIAKLNALRDRADRLYKKVAKLAEYLEDVKALKSARTTALKSLERIKAMTAPLPEIAPGAKLTPEQERAFAESSAFYAEMERDIDAFSRLVGATRR